jgi:hypothetical protein
MDPTDTMINIHWACNNLDALEVIVAQKGDVVDVDCCTLCTLIVIEDALFVKYPYIRTKMGHEFDLNMEWMTRNNMGFVGRTFPSMDDLDQLCKELCTT